jgi:hypothetical protein
MIQHGVYDTDEWQDVDEADLQSHLGVDEAEARHPDIEGNDSVSEEFAESESESDDGDDSELPHPTQPFVSDLGINRVIPLDHLQECQDRVSREVHPGVRTRRMACPFSNSERDDFLQQLSHVIDNQQIPRGFGLLHDKPDFQPFDSAGRIPVGCRQNRFLQVSLPEVIWQPRIVRWVQAVALMTVLQGY